tara:strand:- start:1069 stop:3228 length:2160 start_codon:yes stop_codon:yes gene_type:complete
MKEYNSIYLGMVIQNNDPEKRGRVKVYVPNVSANLYNKWVADKKDKKIKFIGDNINSDITPILEDLKIILPWSEISSPLFGENTSGRFNNFNLAGSISDSNFTSTSQSGSATAPGELYEKSSFRLNDAFNKSGESNFANPYSYMYKPSVYSNKAKGSFGIPSVGAHVYVFFRDGNPLFPVILGASFGNSDWQGIYDSNLDYPGKYENFSRSTTEEDANVDNYRNKYVLNQKGGTFEIINSDLNEKIKLTHYSGSFKELNNQTNIELATKNDQKLVLNDQFETVQGNKNLHTSKNKDEIVKRDNYRKVGNLNKEYYKKWKDIVSVFQDNKQLFETKRAIDNNVKDSSGLILLRRNSTEQKRSGSFENYPVTDGSVKYGTLDGKSNTSPGSLGAYDNNDDISISGSDNPSTNKAPSNANWTELNYNNWGPGGEGKSISTQDGTWDVEDKKENLSTLIQANLKKITDVELELGQGGSEIVEIAKHKLETIGVLMNDFGSIRMDDIGKLTNSEVVVNSSSVYVNKKGTPLLEYVHVQDLPGGNSTLNVSNRYNVMVGAGGLNLKSYGPVNMSGTITNIAGEQINIGSDNEINIDSGKVINISAEILRLRNKNQRQVLIDSSLGINKNVVIGGGMHVEGEVFLQHVTAPREYQESETTIAHGEAVVGSGSSAGTWPVTIFAHSHAFANLPLTLKDTNTDVRESAEVLNSNTDRAAATPRSNTKK